MIYNTSPTTTGGRLIKEFIINNIKFFPMKFFIINREQMYKDTAVAIIVANIEIYSDKKTILINFSLNSIKIL